MLCEHERMKTSLGLALASVLLLATSTASADMPSGPCADAENGDSCELDGGGEGVCENGDCVADDDEGCSVARVGAPIGAGSLSLLSVSALLIARRRGSRG